MHCARRLILTWLALAAIPMVATAKTAQPALPPYTWAYQPVGVDERGLWMEADEAEREIRDSRLVIRDQALTDYIQGVLCRTVGTDRCKGVRIYVLRDAEFNADMSANGMMRIRSGALLRLRSEAELAAVIAHEFAHFELRHTLAQFKQQRGATDAIMWVGIAGGNNAGLLQLALIKSIYSFTREQEREADITSFKYLAASPYRAGAEPEIWSRNLDESDATMAARNQKNPTVPPWLPVRYASDVARAHDLPQGTRRQAG